MTVRILVVAKDDRTLRIEVGYGLEGALTDAACKRIISEIIVPRFRQGDFYGGITAGVERILRVIDGEPLPKPEERRPGGTRGIGPILPVMMILALVVGGVLHTVLGRFPGALVTGGAVSVVAWMLAGAISIALIAGVIAFLFTLLSGGMGGRGLGGGGWAADSEVAGSAAGDSAEVDSAAGFQRRRRRVRRRRRIGAVVTMSMERIARHLMATRWLVNRAFPKDTLIAIERAIKESEATHRGEIRFVVEGALDIGAALAGSNRERTRDRRVFAIADMGYRTQQRRADLPAARGPGRGDRRRPRNPREGGRAGMGEDMPQDGNRFSTGGLIKGE